MAVAKILYNWTVSEALVLVGVIIISWTLWVIVYRVYFHPLAKYPGPFLAKVTDWYMLVATIRARPTYLRHELHQKYGEKVRVGTNEVSFADVDSIKDIYGQSSEPCQKSDFYKGFTVTGVGSVFSTTDRYEHRRMHRLLAHGFSERGVLEYEGELAKFVEVFLNKVYELPGAAEGESVDIYRLLHHLFYDTSSQLSFSQSFNLLQDGPGKVSSQLSSDIDMYFTVCAIMGLLPVSKYFTFGIFRQAREARKRIIPAVRGYVDDFRQSLKTGSKQQGLLRLMIEARDDTEAQESGHPDDAAPAFTDDQLIENAIIFILAGSGTSATALVYLIYELGRRPQVQKRLVDEIRAAFPDPDVLPDADTARSLPYLNCVFQEVLRIRLPLPAAAPRYSPGKIIGNDFVPRGVVISNLFYTTQRDPETFEDPEEFNPDRWLPSHVTPDMKTKYRPFNSGPRSCIGIHLARLQTMLTACALYSRYDITLDQTRSIEDNMIGIDQGLMIPRGEQLWVGLRKRSE